MATLFRNTISKLRVYNSDSLAQVRKLTTPISNESPGSHQQQSNVRPISTGAQLSYTSDSNSSSGSSNLSFNFDVDEKLPKAGGGGASRVGLLGVPTSFGQPREGTELGPQYLRGMLIPKLEELAVDVKEYGDVVMKRVPNDPEVHNLKLPKTHAHHAKKISKAVSQIVKDGRQCITLGGDHSLGLGSVHGHAAVHPGIAVIWIDAHADLNTPLSSPSKNFHGMPASFFIRETQDYVPHLPEFEEIEACISAKDIVYVGLRQMDPGEKVLMEKFGIKHYTMHDVDKLGIARITREIIHYLELGKDRPVHMSVDIDCLDPTIAMSTGTPVLGGLKLREVLFLTEEIRSTANVSVIDMVEINPTLETSFLGQTLQAATHILSTAIGGGRAGLIPDGYVLKKPENTRLKPLEDNSPIPYDVEG